MKKILLLILGCIFIATTLTNAMVNRNGQSFQLIYTDHARDQMKARYLHEIDIELAIEHGEMFSDKVSGEIAYNGRTRLLTFAVVTQLSDQPNKLIIKRLSPAYSKAKKKKGKRTYAAHDKKTIKR